MDPKKRKIDRGSRDQLLTLVNGWDPTGSLAAGAPRNQYDFIVDELLNLLSRNPTVEEVAAFLERKIPSHVGKPIKGSEQFARKAVSWFQIASEEQ